jgi:dipeptidyl aminopeptidase/acylaminoacyl peptidase
MPFEDIMKSTDHLLAGLPNLDPDRLAAAGASYGGYMAAWVLGHTDRFKAIIDHAGVNNSYSQFATDVPHGFAKVMGGTPWENVDGLQRNNRGQEQYSRKAAKPPLTCIPLTHLCVHSSAFHVLAA